MNEHDATRLLANLGERVSVGPAPVDVTLEQGKGNSRRRRAVQMLSAAAVFAVITVGVFLVRGTEGGGGFDATSASPGKSRSGGQETWSEPTPQGEELLPPRTRLVGMGRVVITVPQGWISAIGGCVDLPFEDTVYFPAKVMLTCAGTRPPHTSSVRFYDSRSPSVEGLVAQVRHDGRINGLQVSRIPTQRAGGGIAEGVMVVPSEHLLIWVDAPKRKTVNDVLASVSLVPEGFVAIPTAEGHWQLTREAMVDVGLAVEVSEVRTDQAPPGQIIKTRPSPGTVVPVGSTVSIVVAVR